MMEHGYLPPWLPKSTFKAVIRESLPWASSYATDTASISSIPWGMSILAGNPLGKIVGSYLGIRCKKILTVRQIMVILTFTQRGERHAKSDGIPREIQKDKAMGVDHPRGGCDGLGIHNDVEIMEVLLCRSCITLRAQAPPKNQGSDCISCPGTKLNTSRQTPHLRPPIAILTVACRASQDKDLRASIRQEWAMGKRS
jgi:hypothetical protein